MFVAYYTSKTNSSPCDFYKMTLVAAFGFLMALSALRAPPLPQPSKFSRFKVLLTSYQASRSRSHQQAKQRPAASKGHIEGRRREGQRWAKQDDGLSLVSTHHHLPPLYTTSDFNAILGGGRRWWYGLRGYRRRVSGSRPPRPRWRRARQWIRRRCLAWLACLSALKDFTSPCFSFSSSWFLFWFLVGNGGCYVRGCYVRGCFLFAASRVHMAVGHPGSWQPTSPAMASPPPPTMPRAPTPPWWRHRTATRTTAAAATTAAASFTKSKRTCPSRWGGFCWVLLVLCNFLQHLQFDYVDFHSYTYM